MTHVNKLTEAINEVKSTFKAETYYVDPRDVLETPLILSPLNIEIQAQALDTRV